MVVRDYLVKNFEMDDTRVKTIGLGKSPEVNGDGVEVLVYPVARAEVSTKSTSRPNRRGNSGDGWSTESPGEQFEGS